MANKYNSLTELFTGIANAIRAKKNSTESIVADNFVDEITDLQTGFNYVNDRITAIPDCAFYGCKELNSVECGNITSIGTSSFEDCSNLTSIIIPSLVETIGSSAFKDCSRLTIYCEVTSQPTTWDADWNSSNRPVVWGYVAPDESSTYLTYTFDDETMSAIVTGYIGNYAHVTIPSMVNGYTIVAIRNYAFAYCSSLTSITIPDSVISIGSYAFRDCSNLTSITIGNSVTSIGIYAFCDCTSLTSVTIGNSVTTVGEGAFAYCTELTSITIPDSVTSMGDYAFSSCTSLMSITIPDSVKSIGGSAFRNCSSLTRIIISVPEEDFNVTGAPWGAKNAEIIYAAKNPTNNQTGD